MRRTAPVFVMLALVGLGCSNRRELADREAVKSDNASTISAAQGRLPASTEPPGANTADIPPTTVSPTTVSPTTVPPTTVPPTTTPPTEPPITAPAPPVDPVFVALPADATVIGGNPNNWLGVERKYLVAQGPGDRCATFLPAISPDPYVVAQCGAWRDSAVGYAFTVTQNTLADGIHALLWHETAPQVWEPVLKYVSEPGVLTAITMQALNLDLSPSEELVVLFHYAGTQSLLDIDVLDLASGSIQVVAHLPGLAMGQATAVPDSGVEVWTASIDLSNNSCCLSPFQQSFLRPSWTLTYGEVGQPPQG